MPIYEYACAACGHEFEEWQKMADKPVKKCPKCGKLKVERLISRTSFHLKGGGWYSDLYGSAKPGAGKGESKADGASDGKGESTSSSDAKSETPAAAKSETKSDAKPAKADKGGAGKAGSKAAAK